MDEYDGFVSPEAKTVPMNPIPDCPDSAVPTQQFICRICHAVCSGRGSGDAFQVTVPEAHPLSSLTAHGKFTVALMEAGFIGRTICIHGTSMLVLNDPQTLQFLSSYFSEQDIKALSWVANLLAHVRVYQEL